MSYYPPTFNQSITLFSQHKHLNSETNKTVTVWKKTILKNCFWGTEIAKNLNGNVLVQQNSFILRIPQSDKYLMPLEWSEREYDKLHEYFSLSAGDVIVRGIVSDEINDIQGSRVSDFLEKYKENAFTVKTITENTAIPYAPHYKVTG